nr:hypothetical protein [Tanacetum cinerariifolium]
MGACVRYASYVAFYGVPTVRRSSHCQGRKFPLPEEKRCHAKKIALLLKSKSSSNCQSKSYDNYAKSHLVIVEAITFSKVVDPVLKEHQVVSELGSASNGTGKKKGRTVTLTTDDMQKRKNDIKARTTLLLALPDEHQLWFSKHKTVQELWDAILKTFGGNEATKKMKKNLLKQQYGNFKAEGSETLEQTFNRLQVIVSHLEFMDIEIEKDDLNQKFLTSLPPEWIMHTIHSSGNEEVNIASVSTASTNVSTASANIRTRKKISIQGTDVVGFDKSKVECFNCHKMDHFARECKAPRSQDRGRRDNYRQGSKVKEQAPKALMAIDGVGWDWSYMANDEENHALVADEEDATEFALMAKTSAESEVFDNSLCSKAWLAQVEAKLAEHRNQKVKYCEKIRILEFKTKSRANCIKSLTKELKLIKKEKEGLDSKLAGFQTASKDLGFFLESQRLDKNKEGLGYNVVPPLPAQVYSPPKKDLSWTGLPENPSGTETEASPSTILPKPFIRFVKATDRSTKTKTAKVETAKPTVKYAAMYIKPSKSSNVRGNQRNLNNLKSHQLGVKKGRTCLTNSHKTISPRTVIHKPHRPSMRPVRPNIKFPTVNRKLPTVNRKFPTGNIKFSTADMGNKGKAGSSQNNIDDKGYWDSGCSRNITDNISYLSNYELFKGGYVSFGQGGCKNTSKRTIKTGKLEFENVYIVKDLKHNLVRGLPTKCFENDHSCTACLNGKQHKASYNLGKFVAKGDEGYFIRYSMSSKAFRVFNKRTKRVEENLHVEFLENKAIEKGDGPNWLFDIDSLTNSMNYVPVVSAGTCFTNFSGTKDVASQEIKKDVSSLRYIALPNWIHEVHLESSSSQPQDTCNSDEPKSSGNSNLTATSTNLSADQLETLTVETPIPTVSSPVPTAFFTDSQDPSIDSDGVEADSVWSLVDCPKGLRPIGTKWVLKNKKDERGIVIKNKARLVAQGHTQEEGIDYDEAFAPVARIKAIRLFLAYASFMGFIVYQMDVKSAFLYGTIDEEGKIDQILFIRRQRGDFILVQVYVDDIIFGSSNPQLCREFDALMHEKFQMSAIDIMFAVFACAWYQVTPKECHLHAVKRIFKYLKGHPKLGLWYPKESPFDLVAYSDSDYGGASQDRKSTTGGLSMLCEALSKEISSSILLLFHTAKTFGLVWIWLGGAYGNVFLMGFNGIQWIETTNKGTKILATVDGNLRTVSESSIRRNLKLNDEACIGSLPDAKLFENLQLMGYNILPNQKFTFQKGHYTRRARIAQSLTFPPVADEPASPIRDDSQGEACPTDSGLAADQDRANIAKPFSLPSDSAPRSEMVSRFEAQELEINSLKARIKLLEDKDRRVADQSGDDAPIKGRRLDEGEEASERVSDDTEEMATVLTSMDAASILTTGGVAKELEEQIAKEDQRMSEQIAKDAEVARIHAKEELQMMINSLDRSNETVVKYLQEYEQILKDLSIGERIELISDQIKYQENYAQVLKYQTLQRKPRSKKQKKDYYMAVKEERTQTRAGKHKEIETSEEVQEEVKSSEEVPEEKVKEMMQLVLVEEVWGLVKETLSIRPATSDKKKELWVELKRMFEPNVEDYLWTLIQANSPFFKLNLN